MKRLTSWSFVRGARRFFIRGARQFLFSALVCRALAGSLHAANGVGWNSIDLPPAGVTGQTIRFSANVTNAGTTAWNAAFFLELLDANGTPQNYPSVNGTAPGASANPTFTLTLPPVAGTFMYRFTAMENGVAYFGGVQTRTIVVTPAPAVPLSALTLSRTSVASGDTALATSTAGVAGETIYHGLEGRPTGGTWQNWMVWNGAGGATQTAPVGPAAPGTYEVRAYAARPNASGCYSNSITLTVVPSVAVRATQSVDSPAFMLADGTGIRSTAFPAGQITYHGIETRRNGGAWQNWGVWNDSGGLEQTKYRTPTASGTYEVRAYTARANMASNYSPSSFIAVAAQPGALTPVTILQESRHVNWEEEQDEFGGTGNYSSTMESHPFVLNDGGLLQISTSGDTNTTAWLLSSVHGAVAGASGGGGNFFLTFTAPGPGDYCVWVWREDDTGSGDYDLTVDFTPTEQILPLPGTVLAKPQALPATAANTGGFTANWNGVPGVARFRLDVATDDLFSAASILPAWNNVDVSNTLSFIVTGLTSGVSYFYRVRAINTVGLPSPSSEPVPAAPLGAPPPPPNLGAATAITTGGFTAQWTAIPGVAGYVIDLSQELTFATLVGGWSGVGAGGPTATSKTVTGLAGGTTYYYRVRAFNAIGVGAYSLPRTLTTLPTSAGPSAAVNPGTGLAVDYFSDLTLSQLTDTGTVSQINDYDDNGDSEEQSSRRYTGFVRPYDSEPLTFVLHADDGARLWINHQLLIDTWTQGGGQTSAPVSLSAEQLYALKLEFFQNGGERRVQLLWQGGGQASEVIPASRLYPPGTPPNLPVIGGLHAAGGTFGVAFSAQLMASGSPTGYTVTGPLPTGLVFNPRTGAITGTPTQTGTFRLTIQATNALGTSAPAPLTLTLAKATPVLTVKNESVENQAFLPITPAMIPVNAVAPAVGLPDPTGTIGYTAYRVDIPNQTFRPLLPSYPAVPNSFYYGIDQNYGKLSVTASYDGDANYLPATKTVIFENRDTAPPVFTEGTGLTQLLVAPKSASVRWNAATDPRGVTYDVSLDNGANVFAWSLTKPETVLPNLTAGSIYQVVVRARDSRNNSTMWSAPLAVTTPAAPPAASAVSTWKDLNGDGLADEIIPNEVNPTSSTRFNYFALLEDDREVSFTEWQEIFIYVPGFSYVSANRNYRDTTDFSGPRILVYDQFIPVGIETVTARAFAQVMPVFQFVAEPGYEYSVNRELTRSDGAKLYPRIFPPTLWEALGSVATVHEWSPGGPWLDDSYDAFPHVLVRYGKPIGSISLAGQFAAVTVGTTRGLGGILSVPFPASGNVVISLKDLANQVLKAGPKVVWEVWDRINQIRVGTSTLGDLLDIGINTSGEFQVGLKLDDSTQVWFNVSVQPPPAPKLAVDANRDGTITFDAADGTSVTAPYRFWINDDDDSGDMGGDDIPGNTAGASYADGVVNGTRDLVDFFPVFLDIKQLLAVLPPSASVKYKIKQADSAVNFVYTNLARETTTTRDGALAYQKKILTTGFGPNFTQAAGAATTQQITAAGIELSSTFLTGVKDSDWGVLLIEGRAAATAPLVLSAEKDGTTITEVKLELRISNVEEMFRHIDLTDVPRAYNGTAVAPPAPASSTRTADPGAPYPDSATNGKYFVFFHGFNVNGQRARGWNAEVFKRLYQMGSHARFVGVTWNGATGVQLPNGSYTDYHQAVFHAFQTGDALAARLTSNGVTGDVTIAAHSLGNMVASQAIQYGGFSPSRYYMINAAVPVESYHLGSVSSGDLARMTNVGWRNPPLSNGSGRLFAANWHLLFSSTGDHRSELTWKLRFSNIVPLAYNFYSPGDEVVEDPTTSSPSLLLTVINQGFTSAHGAWGLQELAKGTFSIASVFFSRTQAGWGESGYSISQPEDASPSDASLKVQPFFDSFYATNLINPDATIASAEAGLKNVQYDVLARGIPALSFATAIHPLVPLGTDRNFNMETQGRTQNQWPTEGHTSDSRDAGRWLHSDFKNVALPYVFQMYQEMIKRGSLQ